MSQATGNAPTVYCPSCGRKMVWDSRNRYRPFCSERCKLIDLGHWAADRYRVAGEKIPDDGDGRPLPD